MTLNDLCPCGSETKLSDCCLPLIQGKKKAQTAEELLRARYTAFTRGDIDFIMDSHHSRTRGEIKRDEVEQWSKNSTWLGLKVLEKEAGTPKDEQGTLIFHARYHADGKDQDHFEKSFFEKEGADWRFVDAHGLKQGPYVREEPKVGRNDLCPCGSGKKFKKCCG